MLTSTIRRSWSFSPFSQKSCVQVRKNWNRALWRGEKRTQTAVQIFTFWLRHFSRKFINWYTLVVLQVVAIQLQYKYFQWCSSNSWSRPPSTMRGGIPAKAIGDHKGWFVLVLRRSDRCFPSPSPSFYWNRHRKFKKKTIYNLGC